MMSGALFSPTAPGIVYSLNGCSRSISCCSGSEVRLHTSAVSERKGATGNKFAHKSAESSGWQTRTVKVLMFVAGAEDREV